MTLPNASIIQNTTGVERVTVQSGAVMQKSFNIRCLITARSCQVTWRYPVSSRLVSLRAAVVTVYVQTSQTRKLPTVSQWRFERWTLSIKCRSAGHYIKMFACSSLHRTDGSHAGQRTFRSYFLLIIFAHFWVKNVSDVWVWTQVNKLWEMNYIKSCPSPANAFRKVHKATCHKAILETRHTYCEHECSGVPRNFVRGGGQQIQFRTEDRENGYLGAVAP